MSYVIIMILKCQNIMLKLIFVIEISNTTLHYITSTTAQNQYDILDLHSSIDLNQDITLMHAQQILVE